MHSSEFYSMIKADREREVRAAQRARLIDRRPRDEEADGPSNEGRRFLGRFLGRSFGRKVQSGRANADPSL